jgi:hypothetical protein
VSIKTNTGRPLTALERAAMMIVLEMPRKAGHGGYATTTQVRRRLIEELEMILRQHGCPVDYALGEVRRIQREAKAKHEAFLIEHANNESESEEAQAQRKAQYKAAMQQREQGQRK